MRIGDVVFESFFERSYYMSFFTPVKRSFAVIPLDFLISPRNADFRDKE
jgi:hypothetical protein